MIMGSRALTNLAPAARIQLLLDGVKDYAIYLLDSEGHVATWNTGAELLKGYGADEVVGRHFSTFYTEEDQASKLPQRALQVAATQGRFEAEGWRVRKDGSRFWSHVVIDCVADADGDIIGFAKITRDVTARKSADRALYESEQRFQRLVQGVRDCAIYMLDPAGNITNWNTGAEAIKGYSAAEVLGRNFSMFYTGEDRARGAPQAALDAALQSGKFEGEALRVRKGGEQFWANVLIDPIRDDDGKLLGFAKVTRDVTERRRVAEEMEQTRVALAQAQKMEAIGRLTGGVAHDFNNLLTVIRASAEFLQRPGLAENKRQRYVDAIASAAERAATLTGQLLAFARRQSLQAEVFDVASRLKDLRQIMLASIGSTVRLELDAGDRPLWAIADPNQFDTAMINMVVNARDAMAEGGLIKITSTHAAGVPAVRGHAPAAGGFAAIAIADTGAGMDAQTLAQIFEPFFTTKPEGRGTGLGLSQVYGFAKQSEGEVSVESTLGRGSIFTLYLPEGEPQTVKSKPIATSVGLEIRRILVVEDNIEVGKFAADLLTEIGHHVVRRDDAQSALATLEADPHAFDVVFTDVVMPGQSGVEMAGHIQARWPWLRVVLTSGYSHVLAQDPSHGLPLLRKPYTLDALTKLIGGPRPADLEAALP